MTLGKRLFISVLIITLCVGGVFGQIVATGPYHSLAVKSEGSVWAWGYNAQGQFASGDFNDSISPVIVKDSEGTGFLKGIVAVATGMDSALALKNDGTLYQWGFATEDYIVYGVASFPKLIPNFTDVAAISVGGFHSVALKKDGTVWAWGYNSNGQLGNGDVTVSAAPLMVKNLTDVVAISAGGFHTVALKKDGTVWTWGNNSNGQLGNGTQTSSNKPVQVLNLTEVIAISTEGDYCLALKKNGTVWAWGSNNMGQLGNGTKTNANKVVQVKNSDGSGFLTDIIGVEAGVYVSLAIKRDGTLLAWGYNRNGQLGNGTNNDSDKPVQVKDGSGLQALAGVKSVAAGRHVLAVMNDGTVWAWGYNNKGQLGNGKQSDSNKPVQVVNMNGSDFLVEYVY